MTTLSPVRHTAAAAVIVAGLLTACTVGPPTQRPTTPAQRRTVSPDAARQQRSADASPGAELTTPEVDRTVTSQPTASSTPLTWPMSPAAPGALAAARAWASAANSTSYRDQVPGSWTVRTRPYVTGAEARAEAGLRTAGGGSTWSRIRTDRCVTRLRDLAASVPSDTPSGPRLRIVYVSATVVLSCADGTVDLSDFTAQLTVQRQAGRWRVAAVQH